MKYLLILAALLGLCVTSQAQTLLISPFGGTCNAATTSTLGCVKVDGTSITITGGTISATAGAPAFSAVTAGTNTNALVVGTNGSLAVSGTGTIAATSVTGLSVTATKTLTVTNSLTLSGTDATTMTFPGTSDTVVTLGATQTLTNKTFTAPALGAATATSINKVTITAPTTGSTLTIADGKTLTYNNSITIAGTDATTMTFPATSTTVAGLGIVQTFSAAQTISAAGAASTSPLMFTGALFTGGNGTTTFPYLMLQPSTATAETGWVTTGTFIGVNAASGFAGNFLDFHLNNAASVFFVTSAGAVTAASLSTTTVTSGAVTQTSNNWSLGNSTASFKSASGQFISWSSTAAFSGANDVGIDRNSANVLEVNTGTARGSGGSITALGIIGGSFQQQAASNTGGTCTMSGTSCTITIGHTYTTPVCVATQQSATLTGTYAGCTVSGTTVTITAAVTNTEVWGAFVFGNPN